MVHVRVVFIRAGCCVRCASGGTGRGFRVQVRSDAEKSDTRVNNSAASLTDTSFLRIVERQRRCAGRRGVPRDASETGASPPWAAAAAAAAAPFRPLRRSGLAPCLPKLESRCPPRVAGRATAADAAGPAGLQT